MATQVYLILHRKDMQQTKVIMDWGLGELSPKKQSCMISYNVQSSHKTIQKPNRNGQSLHQKNNGSKSQNKQKIHAIQQTIKILTQSSDEQQKQQLIRVLKKYNKKHESEYNSNRGIKYQDGAELIKNGYNNKSSNVLNNFGFQSQKRASFSNKVDSQTAKRMRFLQNSLLPVHKQDNVSAVLDHQLNEQVGNRMSDSRISGRSHFGNKKNQSAVELGNGHNQFVPIKQKVKDMNQKLKDMYAYDQWCKKRLDNQLALG